MNLAGISEILHDGRSTMEFICKRYERTGTVRCISCGSKKYTFQSRGYLRCGSCRTDYNPFRGARFKTVCISMRKWVMLMYLFDIEASALLASRQTGVSYPATLKAFDHMRCIIVNEMAKTDRRLRSTFGPDGTCFGGKRKGRTAKNKTVMFGILEGRGKARVSIVKNTDAKALLKNTIKAVKRGNITYTDRWHGYDSLVMSGYGNRQASHGKAFAYVRSVHIDSIDGFWSYAKQRLAIYHGIKPSKFLLYIKEMEWRYNNKNRDTFMMLLDYFLK